MEQEPPSTPHIKEIEGDLFDAPDGSVLIHACNCLGSWGAGIAETFKGKYPSAYNTYHNHCLSQSQPSLLLGTCLLIPPSSRTTRSTPPRHWVACLFTSTSYGKSTSPVDVILENTHLALLDLKRQLKILDREAEADDTGDEDGKGKPGKVYACRINSGKFGVKWERSRGVLDSVFPAPAASSTEGKDEGEGREVVVVFVKDP